MKAILSDLQKRENLDVYLTIVLAIIISVLGAFGITKLEIIASAILGILGLSSFNLLQNRRENEKLSNTLGKLNNEIKAAQYLKNRTEYPPFKETLANARTVCLMGPTLVNIFSSWSGYFREEKMKKQGVNFKVLIIDPDSKAVDSMTAFYRHSETVYVKSDLERTISIVDAINEKGTSPGSVELRLMQAHPHLSMVLINPEDDDGTIFVEILDFKTPIHALPHFELSRKRDSQWYEFFLSHFERTWDEAKGHN
ncbi:MAG: hypothetical protein H6654_03135 [Ardenticatenaceae bacterium]|nr:hypothetical protein [Anaerolineales bacterium]MCB8941187.1 hypothetical protein [Ardenticatenaceae bacterium]MCB8972525.1 hypothetical protein [Ardenticatenaceae bacterium]